MVHILLGAVALVTGSQGTTSSLWEQTGLKTGSLGVVVDIVDDDTPFAFYVEGTFGGGIGDVGGADVTLGTGPVGDIIRRVTSGGTSVVRVIEGLFLGLGHHIDEVISRLVSDVSILLGEEMVSTDGSLDLIFGIFFVHEAVSKSRVSGASRRGCRVTVRVAIGGLVAIGWLLAIGRAWVSISWRVGSKNHSGTRQKYRQKKSH